MFPQIYFQTLEKNYEQICDIDVLPVDLKGILHPKMKMLS